MDDDSAVTMIKVILSRVITEDGHLAVRIEIPETYNACEVLGLLEMAKLHVYNELNDQ